ncbi:MAG TPA: aminotransferase class III-fold pyridoxal phosphate-dependent enzyme, partial [Amphiplicatus sp.]|nr:aminotransferase class III-fold pyridoxal phosphate-dependent enzyme [Amphiplicatus sp.]
DGALNVPLRAVKATYNDIEGTRELIRKNREILGAVIIEPMMGAGGCIPASKAFLQMLREETAKNDIVLIFDEVMTSRLSPSGLQGVHGIKPDLTSFGKYMGGGFSFGAVGGAERIMSLLDARVEGALPHPGTFNNNVASMIGGYFALSQHYTPEQNIALNEKGDRLRARLNLLAKEHDADLQFSGLGAVMAAQFVRKPISNPADAENQNAALLRKLLHLGMLSKGVYIAHRCLVTLNMMMTEADLDAFCESFAEFLKENRELLSAEV